MPKLIDITGKRFGRLVVIHRSGQDKHGLVLWRVHCDCGNETNVLGCNLKTGNTTSCGCYGKERARETQQKDISGRKFGRLTVIARDGYISNGTRRRLFAWKCLCDCGKYARVPVRDLASGHTRSCGCYNRERTSTSNKTHGLSKTPAYARAKTRQRAEKKQSLDMNWNHYFEKFLSEYFTECTLCGATSDLATDHVYPLSLGYGLAPGNAVKLCRRCNSRKYNRMPEDLGNEACTRLLSAAQLFKEPLED